MSSEQKGRERKRKKRKNERWVARTTGSPNKERKVSSDPPSFARRVDETRERERGLLTVV